MKVNFNGNAKGVIIMNLNKGKRILIWAFVILIVINISMSIIGGLITHNMNTQFNKTFEEKLIDGEKAENIPSYQKANQIYERSRILLIWLSLFVFIITAGIFWAVVKRLGGYETQLYKEKEELQITLNSIGDGVITTDLNRNILSLNQAAEVYTGWCSEDAVGLPFSQVFQVINVNNGEKAKDPVEEVLSTNDVCSLENHTLLTGKDGIQRHIAHNAAPIKDLEGNTVGVVMVFRDVTERKKYEEEILYLNYHDVLTGLYNRKFFEEETKRLDTERQLPISVIWGDINGLKLINDGFGHSQGDKVLIEMSKILSRCCRNEDIVARIGGDEFCILLPQTTNKDVKEICHRIHMACEEYRQQTEREIFYPSISLGYGTKTIRSESMECLLKKAEAFMYRCKLLESKSMYSSIISSIKTTMSEKSHETEEHAERLVWLSRSMGKQLNLPEEQLNELTLFATLHDIGKMSVDDRILNKPDKLSDEEWSEMKKHTDAGYRIAVASKELIHIAGFILTHHEHWDGSGYPQGLKGQEIPLLSRILAIIDAYDAMTQDRPYRKAMSKMDALKEIHKHAGSQFDPELVEMFMEMTQKGL